MIARFRNGFTAKFSADLKWPVTAVIVEWSPDVPSASERAAIHDAYLRALHRFVDAKKRQGGAQ